MSVSYSPVSVKVLTVIWFVLLSFVWLMFKYNEADEVFKTEGAKLAEKSSFTQWLDRNKPSEKKAEVIAVGYLSLILVLPVAWIAAVVHAASLGSEAKKRAELRAQAAAEVQRCEEELERANQAVEDAWQAVEDAKQANIARGFEFQREVIVRLGSIDQFIRVLAMETDASKRTVALQAAQSEITAITAKVASDSIYAVVVDFREVRELAAETSKDLVRLGLADDRLNRDIVRMFRLTAA